MPQNTVPQLNSNISDIPRLGPMRTLERVQALLPLFTIEIFYFSS